MGEHFDILAALVFLFQAAANSGADTQVGQGQPVSVGKPHVCTDAYPLAAVRAGAEGTTTLKFQVTVDGTVKDIVVESSSGNTDLDNAAVQCAGRWLYKPATRDGKPVEMPWKASIQWKLHTPPAMLAAIRCYRYRTSQGPVPPGAGTSSVNFRVLPDGSMVDAKLVRSSGDTDLDNAALRCVNDGHYDTTILILPKDGVPGHVDLDWSGLVTPPVSKPAPTTTPPEKQI
jgi:TonB family protein